MPSLTNKKTVDVDASWGYPARFSTTITSSKICTRHRHAIAIACVICILSFAILVVILAAVLDDGKNPTNMSFRNSSTESEIDFEAEIEPTVLDADDINPFPPVTNENDDTLDSKIPVWYHIGPEFSGAAVNSQFGFSVSLSHNATLLAIGSPQYLGGRGMVTVYSMVIRNRYQWKEIETPFVGGELGDNIGVTVALSGNGEWLAYTGSGKKGGGVIKILKRDDNNKWVEKAGFEGKNPGAELGVTLKFTKNGRKLVAGTASGEVILYERPDSTKNWRVAGADLKYDEGITQFTSGVISDDGNRIAVGSKDGNSVKVFDWDGEDWGETAELVTEETGYGFGAVLAIAKHGKRIAIGTDRGNYVRVVDYHDSSKKWITVGDVMFGDESDETQFGATLAISSGGNRLAVGSPYHNIGENNATGRVYVYELNESKVWEIVGDVIQGKSDDGLFGFAASMSQHGEYIAVGGPRENAYMSKNGTVKVYEFTAS